jgi:hypothetical protein
MARTLRGSGQRLDVEPRRTRPPARRWTPATRPTSRRSANCATALAHVNGRRCCGTDLRHIEEIGTPTARRPEPSGQEGYSPSHSGAIWPAKADLAVTLFQKMNFVSGRSGLVWDEPTSVNRLSSEESRLSPSTK